MEIISVAFGEKKRKLNMKKQIVLGLLKHIN